MSASRGESESVDVPGSWRELSRVRRAILVADVVESVRIMQSDELGFIDRWRRFVDELALQLLPASQGKLVKSLGDGLLLEFADVTRAVHAAFDMQRRMLAYNVDVSPELQILLRIGVHIADVVVDRMDIYGAGVNLAARLAGLAGPQEVVGSADAVAHLVAGFDADFLDMGECWLKHLDAPVRCYRLTAPHQAPVLREPMPLQPLLGPDASLAVLPFRGDRQSQAHLIGNMVAENLIVRLSASPSLKVTSRMSSMVLAESALDMPAIASRLGVRYLVAGSIVSLAGMTHVFAELIDGQSGHAIWAERRHIELSGLLSDDDECTAELAGLMTRVVIETELQRFCTHALPSIESHSMYWGASVLMHRPVTGDFVRAKEMLECLVERHPRNPVPRAWLARWYVLRVTMNWVQDLRAEASRALEQTQRAIDIDGRCSLALAMDGFVRCHMLDDLDGADGSLARALEVNPNEALAWLFMSVVQGFRNQGQKALNSAEMALSLSPLDPNRHYYLGLASSAAVAGGEYDKAVEWAEQALSVNRAHLSTLRALAIARVELGQIDAAREVGLRIMARDPGFNLSTYLARAPRGAEQNRQRYVRALRTAGIPAGV